MQVLKVQPISDFIGLRIAQTFPTGLPARYVYDRWRRSLEGGRNPRTGKELTEKERAKLQQKIQDYERRIQAGEQPAPPPKTPTTKQTPTPQESSSPQIPQSTGQSISEIVSMLEQATAQFNRVFADQKRIAQPALKQVYDSLRTLSKAAPNMALPAQTYEAAQNLVSILQQAANAEAQDEQYLGQIGQAAQAVAVSLGLNPSQQASRTAPQAAPQAASQAAPQVAPQAAPVIPQSPRGSTNKGWAQGIGELARNLWNIPGNIGRGWRRATPANNKTPILTASMASPSALLYPN